MVSVWRLIHCNYKSSQVKFKGLRNEKRDFFPGRLHSLSWSPASVQVWTHGSCVCWSASRRCRAADHIRDLQSNRLVIIANHKGGCIRKGSWQMTINLRKRSPDCLGAQQPLFHCKAPTDLSRHHNVFWQYFLFIAEGIFMLKNKTEAQCCLWVILINGNNVACGEAVWQRKQNAPPC